MEIRLLAGFALLSWAASTAHGQALPCADRDGDGYLAGPGCAVQQDCNDQNPQVFPGVAESCNGWDDNCNGQIDETCDRSCDALQLTRRVIVKAGGYDPRIAKADRSWAMIYFDNYVPNDGLTFSRIDPRGVRLVEDLVFQDYRGDNEIVWTGREVVNGWDWFSTSFSEPGLYQQNFGPWGRAPGPIVRVLDRPARILTFLWNGFSLDTLWYDSSDTSTSFTRTAADGPIWIERLVLTNMPTYNHHMAWNGDGSGWVSARPAAGPGTNGDLYFRRLDRNGTPVGTETRLTNHSDTPGTWAGSPIIASKGPGEGYGVCWIDSRSGVEGIRCAILDAMGSVVMPPGEILVSTTVKDVGQLFDLAWNGEEFLVAWVNLDIAFTGLGRIEVARLASTGEILARTFATQGPQDGEPRLAWGGTSWGMTIEEWPTYPAGAPAAVFVELGCNCSTDGDVDGVLPCGGGDCDDADPAVAGGFVEVCTDGKDNDCDGLADCNDADCDQNGNPPGEIGGLTFSADKASFQWTANASASRYDVARGVIEDLRGMRNFKWAGCFQSRITGTSASDPETPRPGEGLYYLVRGRAKTCVLGTWGHSGRDGVLVGCP